MIQMLIAGGWMMIPILLCSLVALAIVLERSWYFYHITKTPAKRGLRGIVLAFFLCDEVSEVQAY